MSEDELAIRSAVSSWLEATERGDIESVLDLMTEDALFFLPGQHPMDKSAFGSASRSQAAARLRIQAYCEIQEVQVEGTMGYVWSWLAVTVTAPGADAMRREGHTLTVFRKVSGRWLLHRDANFMARV
jgi:uncharacterized protein (TIGR02246 family)